MQDSNLDNESVTVVKTDIDSKNGQEKCPKCGATDISLNINSGKLRCNFCRHEFESMKVTGMQDDITKLEGQVIGSGAQDIVADCKDIVTFKCSSCGAEVVIDTASSTQARCHWCRNTLSVNEQIPNGSVPDVLLPFSVTKDVAKSQIEKFAVGYSSYPTDCVEEVLKVTNFDEDVAREILDDKEKTLAIWQNGTIMIDGITLCCVYYFVLFFATSLCYNC